MDARILQTASRGGSVWSVIPSLQSVLYIAAKQDNINLDLTRAARLRLMI